MKRVLIISPYFPPSNAADMQRIRTSLPYYNENDWNAEVVAVHEYYSDVQKDELLLQSLPAGVTVHKVKALNKKWTAKIGLGSLGLRSLWYYRKKVNQLLKDSKYDLIFFSTTQFPVCILGPYWKKRFGVPYVIDMQDPWHSEYYKDKPKAQRPPKYWFSYRLHKYLEPIAIKAADGLMGVSQAYIDNLKTRYPQSKNTPSAVITFGYFEKDLAIALANNKAFKNILNSDSKNVVYIGRGGMDLHKAITPVFAFLQENLVRFKNVKLNFIGTSYAPAGRGTRTILPLAQKYGLFEQVVEQTDRVSYYHTLATLQQADALFIPGSDDPAYTASKIYPYLMVNRPLLAIFNPDSAALGFLKECEVKHAYSFNTGLQAGLSEFFEQLVNGTLKADNYNYRILNNYSAKNLTRMQTDLFNRAINNASGTNSNN